MRNFLIALALLALAIRGWSADAVVAADGSGTFKTVQEAINAAPLAADSARLFLIEIKPGT